VAVDGHGNVYISDYGSSRIRKVDASGIITTVAGTSASYLGSTIAKGPAKYALIKYPDAIATDGNGNLYISAEQVVSKIDTFGEITIIAGNAAMGAGFSGDGWQCDYADI